MATIELHMSNFLSTQVGSLVSINITAYSSMVPLSVYGHGLRPDIAMGVGLMIASTGTSLCPLWAEHNTGIDYCQHGALIVRHANETYDFQPIERTLTTPWEVATRTIAQSGFSGDTTSLYSGGYDANQQPSSTTSWLYRGTPKLTNPPGLAAAHQL
jgi:hypothetical protein